jgi:hypothetical protein
VADEHADFLRRLGRFAVNELPASVLTTPTPSRRRQGVAPFRRFGVMALYRLGVLTAVLARLYG